VSTLKRKKNQKVKKEVTCSPGPQKKKYILPARDKNNPELHVLPGPNKNQKKYYLHVIKITLSMRNNIHVLHVLSDGLEVRVVKRLSVQKI
jgi:hypothetical protein